MAHILNGRLLQSTVAAHHWCEVDGHARKYSHAKFSAQMRVAGIKAPEPLAVVLIELQLPELEQI